MFGGDTRDLEQFTEAEVDIWYDAIDTADHAWIIEHDGRCIGTARLHSIDEDANSAVYAVGILDPALLGRGLGRDVTSLVLAYAFETLGLARATLRVLAFNERAIRSYEATGFERTGVDPNAVQIDGEWHDDVLMAIRSETWRRRKRR